MNKPFELKRKDLLTIRFALEDYIRGLAKDKHTNKEFIEEEKERAKSLRDRVYDEYDFRIVNGIL